MDKASQIQRALSRSEALHSVGRAGRFRPLLIALPLVVSLVLLAGALLFSFRLAYADTVSQGVRVGGVSVGGMSKKEALAALEPLYRDRADRSLVFRAAGKEWTSTLADLGASFDLAAAADAAYNVGRTGGWVDRVSAQFQALTGGYSVAEPGLRVDSSRLEAYLKGRAAEIDRQAADSRLVIGDDLTVQVTPSVVGRRLDRSAAATQVERAIAGGVESLDLPVVETKPRRTEQGVEKARAVAVRMLSGPVTLEYAGRRWSLSPKEIEGMISVDQGAGLPIPSVSLQDQLLEQMVDRIAGEVDQPKMNARLDWNGGNLKVLRPGQDGRQLDKAKALAMLKEGISGDQRVVSLPVEVEKSAGGSLDPSTLGIKELIESASTSFAGSVPEKAHNIELAASRLNGVVVPPGEIFSFNKELGPTTLKSGFQIGFGIAVNNGQTETVPSVAGGICQVSTTLLHAVFWAGYQIEERYPHVYWIQSYGVPPKGMIGLDTTVDDPNLDFQFKNTTESYLLIQSKVEGSTLQFALYGTKPSWKVEVEGPIITNVVKADPKPVRQEEPSMPAGKELWVERATDGMDVDIIRRVIQGDDVRTLHLKSRYQPSRNVLMVGAKKP